MAQVRKRLVHNDSADVTGDEDDVAPVDSHGGGPAAAPRRSTLRLVEVSPLQSARLTRRERQCLSWCADGKSYWETAVILGISERTVSFHMEAVRNKLEAATNAHAVAKAMRAGLLGPFAEISRPLQQDLR